MRIYKLKQEASMKQRSSTGWLLKWNIKNSDGTNIWVKSPSNIFYWAGEGYAEVLASTIATDFKIKNTLEYRLCIIELEGVRILACESTNFCKENEIFISNDKLLRLNNKETRYDEQEGYERYILDMKGLTGIDVRKHTEDMIFLDSIICNFDRNLWNMGMLVDPNGGIREAPIFDNGSSFYLERFQGGEFFRESLHTDSKIARPFCIRFDEQLELIRKSRNYETDFNKTNKLLKLLGNEYSDKNNKHGIENPIPIDSLEYIKTMIEKNYKYYRGM